MRAGRRGPGGGRASAGAASIAAASAPPIEADGPRLAESPTAGGFGGAGDRESLERVATSFAAVRVGWETRRVGLSSEALTSVTIRTPATTPSTVSTKKRRKRRSDTRRLL